jgi:poly(3-hydroxybutyrate) depolymerase
VELLNLDFEGIMLHFKKQSGREQLSGYDLLKVADSFELTPTLLNQLNQEWQKQSRQEKSHRFSAFDVDTL